MAHIAAQIMTNESVYDTSLGFMAHISTRFSGYGASDEHGFVDLFAYLHFSISIAYREKWRAVMPVPVVPVIFRPGSERGFLFLFLFLLRIVVVIDRRRAQGEQADEEEHAVIGRDIDVHQGVDRHHHEQHEQRGH